MKFQKLLIKTAYYLIAISIIVLIVLTIYQQYLIKKQLENPPPETFIEFEYTGNSISDPDDMTQEGSMKITAPQEGEKDSEIGMIDNFENYQGAPEEKIETDETYNKGDESEGLKTYPGDIFQSE